MTRKVIFGIFCKITVLPHVVIAPSHSWSVNEVGLEILNYLLTTDI